MHMISKKVSNSAELETLTTSKSPTTAITANGDVQTYEEATVYVKELYIFLTMKAFEDTPSESVARQERRDPQLCQANMLKGKNSETRALLKSRKSSC